MSLLLNFIILVFSVYNGHFENSINENDGPHYASSPTHAHSGNFFRYFILFTSSSWSFSEKSEREHFFFFFVHFCRCFCSKELLAHHLETEKTKNCCQTAHFLTHASETSARTMNAVNILTKRNGQKYAGWNNAVCL